MFGNVQPVPRFMVTDRTALMTQTLDTAGQSFQAQAAPPSGGSDAPAAAPNSTGSAEMLTDLGRGGPTAAHDLQPPKSNRRAQARYIARWRAAIIGEGVKYMGRTENVSLSGAAVLCDANVRPGQELKLYLEVPLNQGTQTAVFEATSVVMHSTLTNQGFRLGVAFRFFQGDSLSILRKALGSGSYRELIDPQYS